MSDQDPPADLNPDPAPAPVVPPVLNIPQDDPPPTTTPVDPYNDQYSDPASWPSFLKIAEGDDADASYRVDFRLRGRRPDQVRSHAVGTLDYARDLARQFQDLGWGGEAVIVRISDDAIVDR